MPRAAPAQWRGKPLLDPLGGSVDSNISSSFKTPVAPGAAVSACGLLEMF